jgi:hypothetical protein
VQGKQTNGGRKTTSKAGSRPIGRQRERLPHDWRYAKAGMAESRPAFAFGNKHLSLEVGSREKHSRQASVPEKPAKMVGGGQLGSGEPLPGQLHCLLVTRNLTPYLLLLL